MTNLFDLDHTSDLAFIISYIWMVEMTYSSLTISICFCKAQDSCDSFPLRSSPALHHGIISNIKFAVS